MHQLNQSSGNNFRWCEYQQSELDRIGVAGLKMAFPGSMLCNHILIPGRSNQTVSDFGFTWPDVSHVVYEYCDGLNRSSLFWNSLVVDIDGNIDDDSIASLVVEQVKERELSRVILLGGNANRQFGEIIRSKLNESIEVRNFEPDWMSASAMHSIYRQASANLFVNTMRVMDAVSTGCNSCLVADQFFQQEPAFPVLQRYLRSADCEIYDEKGSTAVVLDSRSMLSYTVIANSIQAIDKALAQNAVAGALQSNAEEDWFVGLSDEPVTPVIRHYRSSSDRLISGMRDRKTSIIRKMIKLRDDPGAFFLDSQFRMLRTMGRVLQVKPAGIKQ